MKSYKVKHSYLLLSLTVVTSVLTTTFAIYWCQ